MKMEILLSLIVIISVFNKVMGEYISFSTLDIGYCLTLGVLQVEKRIVSSSECWGNCTELVIDNSLTPIEAVEYYEGEENMVLNYPKFDNTQCFCDLICACLTSSVSALETGTIMFPQNTEIPNECGDAEYEDDLDKLQTLLLATFLSIGFITVTVACVYYYNRPQGIPPSLRPASKRSRNTDDVVNNPMNRSSSRESSVD